jgi:hypothetical protein
VFDELVFDELVVGGATFVAMATSRVADTLFAGDEDVLVIPATCGRQAFFLGCEPIASRFQRDFVFVTSM